MLRGNYNLWTLLHIQSCLINIFTSMFRSSPLLTWVPHTQQEECTGHCTVVPTLGSRDGCVCWGRSRPAGGRFQCRLWQSLKHGLVEWHLFYCQHWSRRLLKKMQRWQASAFIKDNTRREPTSQHVLDSAWRGKQVSRCVVMAKMGDCWWEWGGNKTPTCANNKNLSY